MRLRRTVRGSQDTPTPCLKALWRIFLHCNALQIHAVSGATPFPSVATGLFPKQCLRHVDSLAKIMHSRC